LTSKKRLTTKDVQHGRRGLLGQADGRLAGNEPLPEGRRANQLSGEVSGALTFDPMIFKIGTFVLENSEDFYARDQWSLLIKPGIPIGQSGDNRQTLYPNYA
jgi:hypothetical protein